MEVKIQMKKTFKKRAFISAIAMLIVSAIVLTSSTFAWFTMSKKATVEQMNLTVTSPEGIQISANTNAWTTAITLSDLTGESGTRFAADADNTNHFPTELKPSSSRMYVTGSTLPTFFEGSMNDNRELTLTKVTDATGSYVVFDVFLKVAEAQTVYWNNSDITIPEGDNELALRSMRMAVVDCGADADPAVAKTKVSFGTNNYASTYEPASTLHLDESQNGKYVDTRYVYSAVTALSVPDTTVVSHSNYVISSSAKVQATDNSKDSMQFPLEVGINRVRVYIWMEGNDIDCLSDAAGGTLNVDLQFTIA